MGEVWEAQREREHTRVSKSVSKAKAVWAGVWGEQGGLEELWGRVCGGGCAGMREEGVKAADTGRWGCRGAGNSCS